MSVQVTTAFVDDFKSGFRILSQQKKPVLREICRMEPITGDTMYIDAISATEAQPLVDRHGDTPLISTPHSRRKLTVAEYNWADMIDRPDRLKMLADPDNPYTQNALMAFNRTIDDVIITAIFGAAYGGHAGGTTINMYDDGECRLVNSDGTIEAAGSDWDDDDETGLTIAKLLTVKELLDNANIDQDRQRYFITNPHNINELLNTTEVKSSDYNTVKALAQGSIDTFMGFKFLSSTRLPADDTDTGATKCAAVCSGSIVLAVPEEPTVKIAERADKNHSTQIYVEMSLGATRIEGPSVVGILLDTE